MLKRARVIPMSFPTIFFACLLLTTCVHAQSGTRLQQVDLSENDSIKILQLLLENQQTAPDSPESEIGNWVSKLTVIVQNGASRIVTLKAHRLGIPIQIVAGLSTTASPVTSSWREDESYVFARPAPDLWSAMSPAQIFGIGAQTAH